MTHEWLRGVLAFYLLAAAAGDFLQKVNILRAEEPQEPKCFTESKGNLTCFWEEDEENQNGTGDPDQYSFNYTYEMEPSRLCPLRTVLVPGGKQLWVCQLTKVHFFVEMDIQVHRGQKLIHSRSLLAELTFILDPPTNVTLNTTGQRDQLKVTWQVPPLKYMDDSMIYQVGYAAAHAKEQVEETYSASELVLRNLWLGTKYKVRVRVKFDGISYGGFWSAWSPAVAMETPPAEFDPLLLSLCLIISFILIVMSLILLLSNRRFLTKKIWPNIPTPDGKFQGLFTVYDGNFEEWLDHTNGGGLWFTPAFFYSEERPSPLEVLYDLSPAPLLPSPTSSPGIPRVSAADGKEGPAEQVGPALTEERWLMERLRGLRPPPVLSSRSSLLESQDTYVTLSNQAEPLDDILEERVPLEVLFASRKTALGESHSDLVSGQQSSGSGRLSSQSSFEYPNQTWAPRGPAYTYLAVADSGVSIDYSPMSPADYTGKLVIYANDCRNQIPVQRRALLPRHHHVHQDS